MWGEVWECVAIMESFCVDITAALGWGVYILYHQGAVVYVGQSKCPLSRIAAHRSLAKRRGPSWLPILGITFDRAEIVPSHPDRIDEMERALIAFHRPRHNIRHNPPSTLPPTRPRPSAPIFTHRLR